MAKFNEDIVAENHVNSKEHKMECAMFLMGCLTNEEYEQLKEDWNKAGGVKVIKWWEFIFNNVTVKYEREAEEDEDEICFCEKCGCDVTYSPCDCPPDDCRFTDDV